MSHTLVSVIDLAAEQGVLKQTVFKVLKRLGIEATKQRGPNSRGQAISYVTPDEARVVIETIRSARRPEESQTGDSATATDVVLDERDVFYLLLLEPQMDHGRFKVGFAASLPEQLRQLRCSAPLLEVIKTWPCKRLWERTAIDCATVGCERIHTEVFRNAVIAPVLDRCEKFFALMPNISARSDKTAEAAR